MAYCTTAEVQSLTGLTFSGTSRPTTTEVDEFVSDVAAELDGVLQAAGYTLPITDSDALNLLGRYNKFGSAVQAWHAGYLSNDEPPRVAYWRTAYENFLNRLRKGEQELPGEGESEVSSQSIVFDVARNTD
jgi:hypothetical protein